MKKTFLFVLFVFVLSGLCLTAVEAKKEAGPVIKDMETFTYAAMDFGGSFDAIPQKIGVFMGEFQKQGLIPAGNFMGTYFNDPHTVKPEELKWALGFPIAKDTKVKPPLALREFKGRKVAYYLYTGPYEKSDEAYEMIFKYLEEKGYAAEFPVYEKYLNNPMNTKPEDLQTEMIVPLVGK